MFKSLLAGMILWFGLLTSVAGPSNQTIYDAGVVLIHEDHVECSASAIDQRDPLKSPRPYIEETYFLTAAHCVVDRVTGKAYTDLKIGEDSTSSWSASVEVVQYGAPLWVAGQIAYFTPDYAVLRGKLPVKLPLLKVGNHAVEVGERVTVVGIPYGWLKQLAQGFVSNPKILDNDEAKGHFVLNVFGLSFGSSGSAVICESSGEICGIIVMGEEGIFAIVEPITNIFPLLQKVE